MSLFVIEYVYDATRSDEMDVERPKHREFLGGLVDSGVIKLFGPSPAPDGTPGAFVFIEAEDADAALHAVDDDPFHVLGLIAPRTVRPFTVVRGGFAD